MIDNDLLVSYPPYMTAPRFITLTSKGQLVLPAELRRRLRLQKGTRLAVSEDNGQIIIRPVNREFIDLVRGSIRLGPDAVEDMIRSKRRNEW
jgi:AbrB family looped-hinge helix DNA binding protein